MIRKFPLSAWMIERIGEMVEEVAVRNRRIGFKQVQETADRAIAELAPANPSPILTLTGTEIESDATYKSVIAGLH